MGNPHCVIPIDEDPYGTFPFNTLGPAIENNPNFPSKVNVEFVRKLGPNRLQQRTWERGSAETYACGSGACAVAAAHMMTGMTGSTVTIELRGGTLEIEKTADHRMLMTGPATEVFSGDWPTSLPSKR
jgi:diaminopimelate epimerase